MKPQKYTAAKIRNDPTMRSHDPRDLFEIVVEKVISIPQLMFVKLQKKTRNNTRCLNINNFASMLLLTFSSCFY